MNFSDYRIEQDGLVICEPCLCISLFSDLDLSSPGSPDMLGPYRAFLDRFQGQVTYCRLDGNQMHAKRVTPELLQTLPREMEDDKRRKKGGVMAEINSGKSADEILSPSLLFKYSKISRPHTSLRACFPLAWFETEGLAGVQEYIEISLPGFALQAGYVGFCFEWNSEAERVIEPYFLRWLQRHPGLMEPMFSHSVVSYLGVTDLGWMTLLGADFVDRMGGLNALKRATGRVPDVAFDPLPNGAVSIRIGDQPRLGDTLNGDTMEDYRALGKVLAPLRDRQGLHEGMSVAGFDDNQYPGLREKWIDRFFPE